MIVVSDASPLISLAAVHQLELLRELYGQVLIPEAVHREITAGHTALPGAAEVRAAEWIRTVAVTSQILVEALALALDAGEAAAIVLALEHQADLLLMDERRGRTAANRLGCRVVGVLGVLIEAKQGGHLQAVRPVLEVLISAAGFRMSSALCERVLRAAGEAGG